MPQYIFTIGFVVKKYGCSELTRARSAATLARSASVVTPTDSAAASNVFHRFFGSPVFVANALSASQSDIFSERGLDAPRAAPRVVLNNADKTSVLEAAVHAWNIVNAELVKEIRRTPKIDRHVLPSFSGEW